ncbi:MAG TPA: S1C family serine protease, partial [Opitutales bacterium]|nr:S1C family serine protease [Opitutales bacterium]
MLIPLSCGWVYAAGAGPQGVQELAGGREVHDYAALQRRSVELFNQYDASVVRVRATGVEYNPAAQGAKETVRVGTGFFISTEGHVLTTATVAQGARSVWVEHRGRPYAARVLGADARTNIALLKVYELPELFVAIPLVPIAKKPEVGSMVWSLSCPLDLNPTPALGLFCAAEGNFGPRMFPTYYWRVDVASGPGEGGAPVLDLQGRLMGVVVAAVPEIRSSYILPVEAISRIRDELLFDGQVDYGYMGLEVEEKPDLIRGRRIFVSQVIHGGPAEDAGVQVGDELLRIGDYPINSLADVRSASFFVRIGQCVP